MIRNRAICTPLCWIESHQVGRIYRRIIERERRSIWSRILEAIVCLF